MYLFVRDTIEVYRQSEKSRNWKKSYFNEIVLKKRKYKKKKVYKPLFDPELVLIDLKLKSTSGGKLFLFLRNCAWSTEKQINLKNQDKFF